ncbi:phage terminase small subunit P27 family [Acuticoccus sp. M5D2P5]|uniref:phage terminase small subunit P27 family n=1 Tax=Acuticoccus kalidii TaxID=2910977 RepID=UPI001F2B77CF|nr:phage terminase small subunit P27 family [Acuticoccus kalidii]MCF3934148.1 phage terminase small subunit P27 family [Acuticoccus kalidii]MCF3935315.1 phage terminase small subunit P27 family [Acuticoccus kalidii]MCF3935323.1 phage terminase small subunit P27 family [Acuticoccus kalidii]MCF3935836.1 phage terminase small subunit P27 family [Acuticoccus kalidii]
MRGRKPVPTAMKRANGNPGKRKLNAHEPRPADVRPHCPSHLSPLAKAEWRRIAGTLHDMGVVTTVDRAALAAYCQAYGRWVEAERKLAEGPTLIKAPSGYVQQSPWLSVANKQLELMGKYMAELGITPASRSRIALPASTSTHPVTVNLVRFTADDRGELRPAEVTASPLPSKH